MVVGRAFHRAKGTVRMGSRIQLTYALLKMNQYLDVRLHDSRATALLTRRGTNCIQQGSLIRKLYATPLAVVYPVLFDQVIALVET